MNGSVKLVKPPHGLFLRIIKRLGLEKQLKTVKNHLWFFGSAGAVFIFLSVFAFIGLRSVLSNSGFGPYLSLMFSDPGAVFKYWHSFVFSVFEAMPGMAIFVFLLIAAVTLLFVRLAGIYFAKFLSLIKLIKKPHEHGKIS